MGSDQNMPFIQNQDDDDVAYAQALHLSMAYVVPMALKAAVDLDVFEIIAKAGTGAHLSPADIVARIPTTNPNAAFELDRILRYLASFGVFTCENSSTGKRYGLTPMCKFYGKNRYDGGSLVPVIHMNLDKVLQDSWQELKYAVLEGVVPFAKAHGMSFFEYQGAHPRFGMIFHEAKSEISSMVVRKLVDTYTDFNSIKELVDVGSGIGTLLRTIVAKYPHIKGTNFDLPQVISNAPPLPGVEHIGGDMFVSVPSGDVIFLKSPGSQNSESSVASTEFG